VKGERNFPNAQSGDRNNFSSQSIPNIPKGTAAREEYINNVLAVDALSLAFASEELKDISEKLNPKQLTDTNTKKKDDRPIGFCVNNYRGKESVANYGERHSLLEEKKRQWIQLLTTETGARSVPWKKASQCAKDNYKMEAKSLFILLD